MNLLNFYCKANPRCMSLMMPVAIPHVAAAVRHTKAPCRSCVCRAHSIAETSWPASPRSAALSCCSGCQPGAFEQALPAPDGPSSPHPPATAVGDLLRLRRVFATLSDNRSVCPRFQTLLTRAPPAWTSCTVPPVRPVAGSHVIRRGLCLACWLLASVCLRLSLSPGGFSAAQDSTTARLPPTRFITTDLMDLTVHHTHHTPKASSTDALSA